MVEIFNVFNHKYLLILFLGVISDLKRMDWISKTQILTVLRCQLINTLICEN